MPTTSITSSIADTDAVGLLKPAKTLYPNGATLTNAIDSKKLICTSFYHCDKTPTITDDAV
jgi:hypothetical protein